MASKDTYGGCFDLFSDDDSNWDVNPDYEDWSSDETWMPPAPTTRSQTERRRDRRTALLAQQAGGEKSRRSEREQCFLRCHHELVQEQNNHAYVFYIRDHEHNSCHVAACLRFNTLLLLALISLNGCVTFHSECDTLPLSLLYMYTLGDNEH